VKPVAIISLLSLFGLATVGGESLWSPDFKGYLAGRGLAKGDAIAIVIDTASALSFSASNTDSKNLTLEFSGGEGGNIFAFLPQVKTTGTLSTKGAEQYSLKGQILVTVTDVDASGRGMVQGNRAVSLEGKEESLTLSGWVNPKDVDQKGQVPLSRLGEARLVFKTFLAPAQAVLTDSDIQQIISAAQPAATSAAAASPAGATAPAPAAAAGATPAGQPAAAAAQQPSRTLSLTDAKKRELLLIYLNRLIDILFTQ
jgi:hypothetical protein